MPHIIHITDISDPRLAPYAKLTEAQLRSRLDSAAAMFIAESPKVIEVALSQGYRPLSVLCEERHIQGDAARLLAQCPADMPVYTGSRQTLEQLTGYTLTRGVLCAMQRPDPRTAADVCRDARRVAVIHGVCDTTNIGAIFRSAAALGIEAVLLTPDSCDPLNRRSIRVSMGSVFLVPWAWLEGDPCQQLAALGLKSAALALTTEAVTIDNPQLNAEPRLALILGTEGDGLPRHTIDTADYTVIIPMHHQVDSLNVAAASAVAFWQLRIRN